MTEDAVKGPLLDVPRRVFRGDHAPTHVPQILEWIGNEPKEFNRLLVNFDLVVKDFNSRTAEETDPSYQNLRMVKGALGGQQLPEISELLVEPGIGPVLKYKGVVKNIKEMMQRGDMPENERIGRWIAYHKTDTDVKTLVVASIFHTYEELVKTKEGIKDKDIEEDRIIEGLMEIASEHPELELFSALSHKDGMNWVDNYDRFTEEFRRKNGFS